MAVDPQLVGTIQLLPGVVSLLFLKPALANRSKPGGRGLALFVLAVVLYSFGLGAGKFLSDYTTSLWAFNLVLLGAELAGVGWFVLAAEVTEWIPVSRWLGASLGGWLVGIQALLWTNPVHHLFFTADTTLDGVLFEPTYAIGFWIHTVVTYELIVFGTGLLAVETVRSTGIQREQAGLLALASLPPFVANFVTLTDLVFAPYDVTPFGYILSIFLFALVIFSGRFLDIVPVARRTAMGEMDDAVVTLDDQDRVVDCNSSARELFDVDDEYAGMAAAEFFEPLPSEIFDQFEDGVDTEVTITVDDEIRHVSLSTSPVEDGRRSGRVFVVRDITRLKEREQELDLMRQIQSRVLRHNIRNDLQVVMGNTRELENELDGEHTEMARRAAQKAESLLAISDKARIVEQLIDRDPTPTRLDLAAVLEELVEMYRTEYPDVTFALDCPDTCAVEAIPSLELAFENLVENAAEHNDAAEPRVTVALRADGDAVVVTISDNGPGISEQELTVLQQGDETPLEHGSGMGLWVVQWVIDSATASIEYDTDESGTEITVRVPAD